MPMISAGAGKKRRKNFSTIAGDTYKEFAENTSIHGLKYTTQGGISKYEK